MINISIVLFNNELNQIKSLVNDLSNNMELINKIYIIDNSPSSILKVFDEYDLVEYHHYPENLGYGTGHNVAIKYSIKDNIDYHLVVNPDIHIPINVIKQLHDYMDSNQDVGNVMPDIHYPDGARQHVCKLLPTPLSLFSRRFLPRLISDKFDNKYNLLNVDYTKEMNVPLLSGCFMFLKVKALEDVGLFDPRYFMYLEDFDLNRRIHIKYKTMFVPFTQVIHEHAKGSYKNRKLMIYHIKSAIKYFNKWGWVFDSSRKKINNTFLKKYLNNGT